MSTVKSLLTAIQEEYTALFPLSTSIVSQGCLGDGSDDSAHSLIVCLGTKAEWGCTAHNDLYRITFWIHNKADANGKYKIECDGASISVHDESVQHYKNRRVKFGWRQKTNTAEKLVPQMKKFFEKMHAVTTEEIENIDSKYHKYL